MEKFKCTCGADSWIDCGEQAEPRYLCKLCWYKKYKPDSAMVVMLEKEKINELLMRAVS